MKCKKCKQIFAYINYLCYLCTENKHKWHIYMEVTTPSPQNAVLLQGCTLQDIERMINKAVGERMKAFYESIREKPPVMIKRKDAAQRLGVSLPTIDMYGKHGILHPKHLGGRVYYDEAEIEKYRQDNKHKSY